MTSSFPRLLAITAVLVVGSALAPTGASATFTPVSTAVRANSSNSNWTDESNGLRVRCPVSPFDGSSSADGRSISGTWAFTSGGGVTCTESLFGSSVTFASRGNITWRSTASVAGTSASGTWAFDSGFEMTIRPSLGSARSIRGAQTPTNCTWTFTPPAILRTTCNTIAADGGGESGFAGTYTFNRTITIS